MAAADGFAARLHGIGVPLKYGLAGALAAAMAARWVPQDVISAAFVALICCRPAVVSALREARDQVLATALGVALTVLALSVVGPGAIAIGIGAAITWVVSVGLRWPYAVTVVALFSVVYMGVLTESPTGWAGTALMRAGSLGLGVVAALVVNVATAPLLGRVNFEVRLAAARSDVRALLNTLAAGLAARDGAALDGARAAFAGLYASLAEIQVELLDLRRDARLVRGLVGKPGDAGRDRAAFAARDLEQVVHHAQDAVDAARALIATTPGAGATTGAMGGVAAGATAGATAGPVADALVAEAARVLGEAAGALDRADAGRHDEAVALAQAAARRVRERDAALVPPSEVDHRLGPRLVLLVALAGLLDHTCRAVTALAGPNPEGARS